MRQNLVHSVSYLKSRRKDLRTKLTAAEAALWSALKGSALKNRKFTRQHSIGNYIADFYCPAEKLVIELDGAVHNDPMQLLFDQERDAWLKDKRYTVLRFENQHVFNDLPGVIREIESKFAAC